MPEALVHFKGKIIPAIDAKVNIMTHALHYGTAVFEGIRGNWNEDKQKMFVFRMKEHYVRLLQGAKMLLMDIPYNAEDLCEITINLIKESKYKQDLYIRPLVYKSEELVANLKLQDIDSDFALMMVPFGNYLESDGALKCCTSSWRRIDDTMIPPRVKISGHYVNSILAKTEATLAGFDEAILLTQDGYVSEGSGENLFLVANDTLVTPPVSDNNLTGITRDSAMTIASNQLNMNILERRIRRSELYFADEVFLTGTAAHIQSVGELDKRTIGSGGPGKIAGKINDIYQSAIRGKNDQYIDWCIGIDV
jgi:branched-chain amino acid aminotransferase